VSIEWSVIGITEYVTLTYSHNNHGNEMTGPAPQELCGACEFYSEDVNGGTSQLQAAVPQTTVKICLHQHDQSQSQSQSYSTTGGLPPVSPSSRWDPLGA
jgi:hypothetical protein